jgi:peptide/nickel transport system permease protein
MRSLMRFRHSVPGRIGGVLIVALALSAFGAPLISRLDPTEVDAMRILSPPAAGHPFGTDDLGRDLFTRVLYGTRTSVLIGITVGLSTGVCGLLVGAAAGYYRRLDNPLMRGMDVLMGFPAILLALGIVAILGPRLSNIIVALVITFTPRSARVVRSAFLSVKEFAFVEAARSCGASDGRIIFRHLLPHCVSILIVQQSYILAVSILVEAALNFLGVGVPPEVATLGGILSDARSHLRYAPWMSLLPGAFISLLVFGFNLLGDGLRDALDPRLTL